MRQALQLLSQRPGERPELPGRGYSGTGYASPRLRVAARSA